MHDAIPTKVDLFLSVTYGTGTKLLVWLLNFFDWEEDPDPDAHTRF
jgi:hypothetical protein